MGALEVSILVGFLGLVFQLLVRRELGKLDDPAYLRQGGVVIVMPSALDAHSPSIGRYMDSEVWGSVTFKGMLYRFDRVVPPEERESIGARELYLSPGLVYVTS